MMLLQKSDENFHTNPHAQRGSKKLDVEQVAKTIVNISDLITNISIIREVELNPLFVYEESVIAVDARVILK